MRETVCTIGLTVAASGALARSAMVVVGGIRSVLMRRRFVTVRFGLAEALNYPEALVLAAVCVILLTASGDGSKASLGEACAAAAGAAAVLGAWALTVWSFRSWPGLFVGHAVAASQGLVTTGAYGFVRHPVYLAVLLLWAGVSLAFLSLIAALVMLLYVVPSYLLYMRSEEAMMEEFGDAYRRYREQVPMLVPRLRGGTRPQAVPR